MENIKKLFWGHQLQQQKALQDWSSFSIGAHWIDSRMFMDNVIIDLHRGHFLNVAVATNVVYLASSLLASIRRDNSVSGHPSFARWRPTAEDLLHSWSQQVWINRFIRISGPVSGIEEGEDEAGDGADDDDNQACDAGIPHVRYVVNRQMVPPEILFIARNKFKT